MPIIIAITLILLIVLIGWVWSNLNGIEKSKKIAFIVISILLMWIVTSIVFNISKGSISYDNPQIEQTIANTFIPLFTILNGFVFIQYLARIAGKLKKEEFTKKQVTHRIAFLIVIFVIVIVLECGYMEDTQRDVLNLYLANR